MGNTRICICAALLVISTSLSGCSGMNRTPEEWLSLSIAGLAGTDRYAFSGQTTVSTPDGWTAAPLTFKGEIVDHDQLTAQTEQGKQLEWSPVELLEQLKKADKEVTMSKEAVDPATVKLQVHVADKSASELWKRQLTEELDSLSDNAPLEDSAYKKEWTKELNESRQALSTMLQTLKVQSQYEVVIDRKNLVPLQLNEHTTLMYDKDNVHKEEKRMTNVIFDSFDGTSSNTVK